MTTFDYLERVVVEGQLQVDDIGNCVLRARNDLGEEFYLFTRSEMGWVEVIEYGPCLPDLEILPMAVNLKYVRYEYSALKLERMIDKFLNDAKKLITQADEIDMSDIHPYIKMSLQKIFNEVEDDTKRDNS